MTTPPPLAARQCQPCDSQTPRLTQQQIDALLPQLKGWKQYDHLISKTYHFNDYYQTIAFVNALAWLSHQQDHHPQLTVSYNSCQVDYTTHVLHGLSENDFICAAHIDELFQP